MKNINLKIAGIFLISIMQSCATIDKITEVEQREIPPNISETNIYLIGDAGSITNNQQTKVLHALDQNIQNATKNDVLLFLGDNIYPKGFDEKNPDAAAKSLDPQLELAKKFKGKVIFIPGNHDWYSGVDGLKRQEKYIVDALGKNSFLPEKGCPIAQYEISKDLILLIVDSEWYLTDWDKHSKINDNCEINTRDKFWAELKSVINKNQNKTMVFAIHHPLKSNGSHGGQYFKNPSKCIEKCFGRESSGQ